VKETQRLFSQIELLPPSPALLPKLLPALADVNANFDKVVDLIELDPALTAKLLQICNSAFFGSSSPVTDVRQAVHLAGYQAVYLLVAMINGGECFKMPPLAGLDAKQLWHHSVTAAFGAKCVAESAHFESGSIFTAGLLHDIGKIVLARARGSEYGELLASARQTNTPLAQVENAAYGYSHADAGACLLERWQLPAPLVEGVRYHHDLSAAPAEMQPVTACVCLGNLLAHSEGQPISAENGEFKAALDKLRLSPNEIENWQNQMSTYESMIAMMTEV
jgi:putative nucleotidyltransferase with HDIG domain